jgi:uncharacterized protein involved in exopolysaccharide biosynthesis/Mrp family chromosome partitioning ATPase
MNLDEVLFILFRHKWKILLCAALGIGAAAFVYLSHQPVYESEAKLLLRYVVDRSAIDSLDSQPKAPGINGEGLISTEIDILKSWDLAEQVATAVGVERLSPEGADADAKIAATRNILMGLNVAAQKGGNVITASYKNPDPKLAVRVLENLIALYFVKHLEVHRSADAFNFVAQQSSQVRNQLKQTEEELKQLKTKAGVTSLSADTTTLTAELARVREALSSAQTEYAGQSAFIKELEKSLAAQTKSLSSAKPADTSSEVVQQYRSLVTRLAEARQAELDYLTRYARKPTQSEIVAELDAPRKPRHQTLGPVDTNRKPPVGGSGFLGKDRELAREIARKRYQRQNNSGFAYQVGKKNFDELVKEAEQEVLVQRSGQFGTDKTAEDQFLKVGEMQIENLEKQLGDLEKRFPALVNTVPAASLQVRQLDLSSDRARLTEIVARIDSLKSRLEGLQKQSEQLSQFGPEIAQLERKREIEETNYKYFEASLEKARVDEALDPSKIPNISAVQKPSPAMRTTANLKRKVIGLAGGGLALGVALAFLIELVVDRSIKRPLELTTRLRIPMLLWIPRLPNRRRLSLPWQRHSRNGSVAPWEPGHFIRPFAEALRDRLTIYFQVTRMIQKPKLVAVTGSSRGVGTSTLAGGLAVSLSETGDGKVLLVDMNTGNGTVHPFQRGAPPCPLSEALVGDPPSAGENLYLAVVNPPGTPQGQVVPRRFNDLVPHLRASDFDYIIFDMPPLSQTTVTLAMAGYMDKVVLVAEAEKCNRQVVKRAYMELASINANVSAVLNKLRFYTPKWLAAEG